MTKPIEYQNPAMTRRRFLTMTGAASILTLAGTSRSVSSGNLLNKQIAVLTPRSTIYPRLAADFVSGLSSKLHQIIFNTGQPPLSTRTFETAVQQSVFKEKLISLLDRTNPAEVVLFASSQMGQQLAEISSLAKVPFVLVNSGVNISKHPLPLTEISLQEWQAQWTLGQWAASTLGDSTVVSAAFHDSGYDSLYAFEQAFHQAGSTVLATNISHIPGKPLSFATLFSLIRQKKPAFVTAFYGGRDADDFIEAWSEQTDLHRLPVVGNRFLLDAAAQHRKGASLLGATAVAARSADFSTSPIISSFEQLGAEVMHYLLNGQSSTEYLIVQLKRNVGRKQITIQDSYTPPIPTNNVQPPAVKTGWLNPYLVA